MADTGNARGGAGEKLSTASTEIELYQEILDFFRGRAGRVFTEELERRVQSMQKELQSEMNKRDRDMFLKGEIAEVLRVLNTPERLRRKAKGE